MTAFARRHYEAIADVLKHRGDMVADAFNGASDATLKPAIAARARELQQTAIEFSDMFARDNEGYKPERFAKRAGFRIIGRASWKLEAMGADAD